MEYTHEIIQPQENLPAWIVIHDATHNHMVPKHWHRSLEIIYSHDVDVPISVWIEGREQTLHLQDFVLINGNEVHAVIPSPFSHGGAMSIAISYEFIKSLYPGVDDIYFLLEEACPQRQDIAHILATLYKMYTTPQECYSYLRVNGLLYELMYLLFTYFKRDKAVQSTPRTQKYRDRFAGVLDYVKDHCDDSITLEAVADHCGISREHLSRSFKKYMGSTFKEYLDSVRMEHAYRDLIDSDHSVLQISLDNGFGDARTFIRVFKRLYGETPYQYKLRLRQNAAV